VTSPIQMDEKMQILVNNCLRGNWWVDLFVYCFVVVFAIVFEVTSLANFHEGPLRYSGIMMLKGTGFWGFFQSKGRVNTCLLEAKDQGLTDYDKEEHAWVRIAPNQ
jgi:hypothetical protein